MTKQELIEQMTETMRLNHDRTVSKLDVAALLDSLGHVVTQRLQAGGDVTLPGLGKLQVNDKAARTGRNPSTGEAIQIPAKRVPKFTPTKSLKDLLA